MQSPTLEFLEITLLNTSAPSHVRGKKKYSSNDEACLHQETWITDFLNLVYGDDIPWCLVALQVFDSEDFIIYIIYLLRNNANC